MRKKNFIVIIILLVLVILGLIGYILIDKGVLNENKKEEKKENNAKTVEKTQVNKNLDINSDLVKNLVYPKSNSVVYSTYPNEGLLNSLYQHKTYSNFVLKDETITNYNLSGLVAASLNSSTPSEEVDCYLDAEGKLIHDTGNSLKGICRKWTEEDIKNDIYKVFGKDINYSAADLSNTYCGYPEYYDDNTKSYYGTQACGGTGFITFKPILKTYKAFSRNNNIYIYDYALINYVNSNADEGTTSLLFDSYDAYKKYEESKTIDVAIGTSSSEQEAEDKLQELINEEKAKTYIWVFKKQSDGKYYYNSSYWQK